GRLPGRRAAGARAGGRRPGHPDRRRLLPAHARRVQAGLGAGDRPHPLRAGLALARAAVRAPVTGAARARAAAVGALAALFALGYGLRFGVHNQHTYLLRAARRAQPALFARDWLVAQATDYHPAFSALAGALLASPRPAWAVALANLLVLFLAALLVHGLAREAAGGDARAGLAAFLVVLGWASFAAQHEVLGSVGVSALFTN